MFSGIPSNLIEEVKINNCYFGNAGLPTAIDSSADPKAFPDWRNIAVPEIDAAYPDLNRFGPMPTSGLFIRHLKNLEMDHIEFASTNPDPRPAIWLEDVHRVDFFAITAAPKPNFVLRNVTDLRILWSRAAKDTTLATATDQML
jgi:hypothetical protein